MSDPEIETLATLIRRTPINEMSNAFDRMIEATRNRDDAAYEAAKADFYGAAALAREIANA
jgi:hypothetical protein